MKIHAMVTGQELVQPEYGESFVLVHARNKKRKFSFSIEPHQAHTYFVKRKITIEVTPQ